MVDRFLENPNLPQNNASYVVMSDDKPEIIVELLNNYHVSIITPKPLDHISGAEKYHADGRNHAPGGVRVRSAERQSHGQGLSRANAD